MNLEEFARLTAPRTTRDTPLANDGDPLPRRHPGVSPTVREEEHEQQRPTVHERP